MSIHVRLYIYIPIYLYIAISLYLNIEFMFFRVRYDTGFVGNVKRFNTALSRAVCLVVAVGDEAILKVNIVCIYIDISPPIPLL